MLVFNGAEGQLQIILGRGTDVIKAADITASGKIMEYLVPTVARLLSSAGIKGQDLRGIACVRGPGSFTGLRLVLATAFGLSRGWNVPLAGLDYLPLLAAGPAPLFIGTLGVLTHARKHQVYLQAFRCPEMTPLFAPMTPTLEDAVSLLSSQESPVSILGSGIRRNLDFWSHGSLKFTILDQVWDNPKPETLLAYAAQATLSNDPIAPIYLRPSDAEENLDLICSQRGISVTTAQKNIPNFLS